MRVQLFDNPSEFLTVADPYFRSDPFSANVIAVVTTRAAAPSAPVEHGHLWAAIWNADGNLAGLAMHTPPFPLFLSRMPPEAAMALAAALADADRDPPGVSGARESTTAFTEAWRGETGHQSTLVAAMRMYRLDQLAAPGTVPGAPAPAVTPADVELVTAWLSAFQQEALPHEPAEATAALATVAERRIAAGEIHLWRHGGSTVSLAGVSAPAAGVARVGPVYTPPHERRQGYGAAVTAAASAAAIAAGAEHVVLYTDLANPTSNSIYQAIGFRADHDAERRSFH